MKNEINEFLSKNKSGDRNKTALIYIEKDN